MNARLVAASLSLGGLLWSRVPAAAELPVFVAVPAQSAVTFVGTQQGEKFTGVIRDYDVRVSYAADQLAAGHIDVTLRLKGMTTGSADRDAAIGDVAWFDLGKFPTATFHAAGFRAAPNGILSDGELTLKGRTKRIAFPFSWRPTPAGATLDARVTLDRLEFGIGSGEWADESMVGRKVDVVVHVTLAPAPHKS